MDNVQIEILGDDSEIQGVLDVGNTKNFTMNLTSSIADIKDVSTRSGSFSTSFKIPSTKENDNLLDHIYLSGQKNYKDFDGEKDCRIRVNGINIEKGRLQITRIAREGRDGNSYSLKFFGNNMDWVLRMKELTTKDLPYLDTTLSFDDTSIENTWNNTGGNEQPVYSLINRGQKSVLDEWNVLDVRPDYFVRDYLDNAFKAVGYNFESAFFSTTANSRLIIPFFGKNFRDDDRADANEAIVKLDTTITNFEDTFTTAAGNYNEILGFNAITTQQQVDQRLNYEANTFTAHSASAGGGIRITASSQGASFDDSPAPLKDPSNNFISNEYIVPYNNRYRVTGLVEAVLTEDKLKWDNGDFLPPQLDYYVKLTRGAAVSIFQVSGQGGGNVSLSTISANRQARTFNRKIGTSWFNAQAGDILEVGYTLRVNRGQGNYAADSFYFKLEHNPRAIEFIPYPYLDEGDTFNWSTVSDDTISMLDIVTDIGKVFNIYWRTNTFNKTVYAEPRDDFYDDISLAEDYTEKVDVSKQFEITYNSSFYNENQIFKYKEDDKDGYLKARNEEASTEWCSYEHTFPPKFKDGTTKVETKALSATYTIEDIYCGATVPPILSRFWVHETNLQSIYKSEDLAPRLLYYRYGTQTDIDGNLRDFNWRGEATNRTLIPYSLPFPVIDEGVTMADVAGKLTFKEVEGGDGLWYEHYRKTATEIREGKRLKMNLRFDLVDYNDLNFRKVYYFDERYPEIEGYWRLVRLSGFKPTSGEISVTHEFIQAKNFVQEAPTPDSIDPIEKGLDSDYQAARYIPPNTGGNSSRSISSGKDGVNFGYDNDIADSGNIAFGNGLTDGGENNVRVGVNNLDVSTDIFQVGAGSPENPYSIIRVDEVGDTYLAGINITTDSLTNDYHSGYNYIAAEEEILIKYNRQMTNWNTLTVDGTLIVDGDLILR